MGIGKGTGPGGPRPGFGGKQPGAGRPRKPAVVVTGIDTTDELTFLSGVMKNEKLDIKERIGAAKALVMAKRSVTKPLGKKEQAKVDAAQESQSGPFGSGSAPKGPSLVPIKKVA